MERVTMYRTTDIHLHLVKTKERETRDKRQERLKTSTTSRIDKPTCK